MYPTSSQRKYWLFENDEALAKMRSEANRKFVARRGGAGKNNQNFLTEAEEFHLCRHYEFMMRDFCRKFLPTMPRCVMGTAFNYFKRFYLRNSVMDFHPYEISLTCVYLAAKVEEFNISISQFVENARREPQKTTDMILNNELLLMQQLSYHLTIHNPFRPVEGFFIDMKTRCSELESVESLRPIVEDFVDHSFLTDVCLLFSSSQIALAAILHAVKKRGENIDSYVKNTLLGSMAPEKLPKLLEAVKKIRKAVKAIENSHHGPVKNIEKKLSLCRNQENNPDSQTYKRKMQEMFEEEENRSLRKYARIAEQQQQAELELIGMIGKGEDSS
uniref:Cyclin-H n=1 Tax=Strigamia maritima TaxID=126957 RepID=T1J4E6_STRMM